MTKRTMIAAGLACASLAVAGCGGDDDSTSAAQVRRRPRRRRSRPPSYAVVNVEIGDNFYKPQDLTIQKGQTIKWKNDGAVAHTVTSDSDSSVKFDSSTLNPKAVYALKPTAAGKLTYYCTIHGKVPVRHHHRRTVTGRRSHTTHGAMNGKPGR